MTTKTMMTTTSTKTRRKKLKKTGNSLFETKPLSPASYKRRDLMKRFGTAFLVAFLLLAVAGAFAQTPKKGDVGTRSVEGVVSNPDDSPAVGAVVQLENT